MPSGTYINNVFAPHLHKSNADSELVDAEGMLEYYRDRLLILVAMPPMTVDEGDGPVAWPDYVRREVDSIIEGIEDECVKRFLAYRIADNPEDCRDELVDADWPEGREK